MMAEWRIESLADDQTVSIEQAIYTGLGAASTCWEHMEGTGVFDSEKANAVGEELIRLLEQVGVDVHARIPYPNDESQSTGGDHRG